MISGKSLLTAGIISNSQTFNRGEIVDILSKNDKLLGCGIIAYDSIQNLGEDKTFQINTTSVTVEETAKKIESVINRTSKGDVIDWLADITQKNDLKKFFPD